MKSLEGFAQEDFILEIERLTAIVNASGDAMIATNSAGIITHWNSSAETIFGPSAQEVLGQTFQISEVLSRMKSGEQIDEAMTPHTFKDGRKGYISLKAFPIKKLNGEIIGSAILARDISVQVQLKKAMEERAEKLAKSNSDLEKFAYIASHDLQEPVRTVLGFGTLLKNELGSSLSNDAKEYLHFMTDASHRMQNLIDDLLIYSRVDTRRAQFSEHPLKGIVEQAKANLKAAIDSSGAEIIIHSLPSLNVDHGQMLQIFQNLIGNALKFRTKEKNPVIEIEAKQLPSSDWQISVRDNGIGIESRFLQRIFEVFQRLHTREEYPGNGIGLSICKKIADHHGGKIWAESTPQKGSTFYFTISSNLKNNEEEEVFKRAGSF